MSRLKVLIGAVQRAKEAARRRFAVVDIAFSTFESFGEDDGGPYSAALTYYTFFAIFPLALFAISVLGFVLAKRPDLEAQLLAAGADAFPVVGDVVQQTALDTIRERRQEIALTAIPLALYAGTGGIAALTHALNVMLDVPREQEANWLGKRVKALKWLGLLGVAALLSLVLGSAASFSQQLFGLGKESIVARTVGHLAGFAVGVFVFATAFKLLPAKRQGWRDVLPGAILGAFAFELLKELGAWYLERGTRGREAAFGAFATSAGLLVISFLLAQITLLSAELNAVLQERRGAPLRGPRSRDRKEKSSFGVMQRSIEGGTVADPHTSDTYDGNRADEKSAGQLMKEITEGLSTLVRKEIELAKQEIGQSVATKVKGVAIIAIGGVFAFFALIFLLLALRDGLDEFLWTWAADLVTAAVLVAIGLVAALIARSKLARPISADMTKQTIKEDVEWAKTLGRR